MPALDTNVLVRFFVRDEAAQTALAADLIQRCLRQKQPQFVPVSVMLELEWVLRSAFGFGKDELVGSLSKLADGLHMALAAHAGERPLWTFDRVAARLEGFAPRFVVPVALPD